MHISQPVFLVCSDVSEMISCSRTTRPLSKVTEKKNKQTLTKLGHFRVVIHTNEFKSNVSVRV